ncbi:hypothetical protein M9Y10_041093 [Tritrichomonas musculus]|uniref:Uncharacterized protein n=1 Tax=Tritrichomonas musculus TaxID=1915356 RepID=A0ABR2K3E6_9EUKA
MFENLQHHFDLFFTDGYLIVFDSLFNSPQYYFWSTIQALWVLYVVHRSYRIFPKTYSRYVNQFVLGLLMTFGGREISAMKIGDESPLKLNPYTPIIFGILFILYELTPYDIFYIIINRLFYFLGLLQGSNQARYFVYLSSKLPQDIPVVFLCALFDQLTERYLRLLFGGRGTPISDVNTIIRNLIFCCFYFGITNQGMISDLLGLYDIQFPALFLAAITGFFNALDNFGDKYDRMDPEEDEKERIKFEESKKWKNEKSMDAAEEKDDKNKSDSVQGPNKKNKKSGKRNKK